jgi:archaemetzincin
MKYQSFLFLLVAFFLIQCSNDNQGSDSRLITKTVSEKKIILKSSNLKDVKSKQLIIIDIQPYAEIPDNLVNYVYKELCKIYPHVNLLKSIPLPKRAYYVPRNRYRADTLIYLLRSNTKDGHVTIGLTSKDISSDKGSIIDFGIMGLGFQPGKSCVVSPFRLSKNNLKDQFFKVAIHELGHTQGLSHCPDKTCIMTDANSKNTTENETGFCKKCNAFLKVKGWRI